jgi:hypothetical protein
LKTTEVLEGVEVAGELRDLDFDLAFLGYMITCLPYTVFFFYLDRDRLRSADLLLD